MLFYPTNRTSTEPASAREDLLMPSAPSSWNRKLGEHDFLGLLLPGCEPDDAGALRTSSHCPRISWRCQLCKSAKFSGSRSCSYADIYLPDLGSFPSSPHFFFALKRTRSCRLYAEIACRYPAQYSSLAHLSCSNTNLHQPSLPLA